MTRPALPGPADCLALAAAPTFAVMALLTWAGVGGAPDPICGGASPLAGMTPMYLLMAAFHAGPWLRLTSATAGTGRSRGTARSAR